MVVWLLPARKGGVGDRCDQPRGRGDWLGGFVTFVAAGPMKTPDLLVAEGLMYSGLRQY